jgi:AAA-like domain
MSLAQDLLPSAISDRIFGKPPLEATAWESALKGKRGEHLGWIGRKEKAWQIDRPRYAFFAAELKIADSLSAADEHDLRKQITSWLDALSRTAAFAGGGKYREVFDQSRRCVVLALNHVVPTELWGVLQTEPKMSFYRRRSGRYRLIVIGVRLQLTPANQDREIAEIARALGGLVRPLHADEAQAVQTAAFGAKADPEPAIEFDPKSFLADSPSGPEMLTVAALTSLDGSTYSASDRSQSSLKISNSAPQTLLAALRSGARAVWISFHLVPQRALHERVKKQYEDAVASLDNRERKAPDATKQIDALRKDAAFLEAALAELDPEGVPYLADCRVCSVWPLATNGMTAEEQIRQRSSSAAGLWSILESRQLDGLESSQPSGRPGPAFRHVIECSYLAASGLFAVAKGGDANGVHCGLSVGDLQTVRFDPDGCKRGLGPVVMVLGATGSGKTHLGQFLAEQIALIGRKIVFVNLKGEGDTRSPAILNMGGYVLNVSDIIALKLDGPMDPMRANAFRFDAQGRSTAQLGPNGKLIETFDASDIVTSTRNYLLAAIFPSASGDGKDDLNRQLTAAAKMAVDDGCTCITQMLDRKYWVRVDGSTMEQWGRICNAVADGKKDPIISVCIGEHHSPTGSTLQFDGQVTLIEPGTLSLSKSSPQVAALLAMVVIQAGISLRATPENPEGGLLVVDEAHIATGIHETRELLLERFRIYRQHRVTVMMLTQRANDISEFKDFARSVFIGAFPEDNDDNEEGQAKAALKMIKMPPRSLNGMRPTFTEDGKTLIKPATWILAVTGADTVSSVVEFTVDTDPEANKRYYASGAVAA